MRIHFHPGTPIIPNGRPRGPSAEAQVRLLFDTGATWTLIRPRVLEKVGIDPRQAKGHRPVTTVSGVARAAVVAVPSLAILGTLRHDFEVVARALPPSAPIDGLLGLDFLVGLRLGLDMGVGQLTMES